MAPDGGTGGGTELFSFKLCGILEFIRFLLGLLGERQTENYQSQPDTCVKDLRNCPSLTLRVGILQSAARLNEL